MLGGLMSVTHTSARGIVAAIAAIAVAIATMCTPAEPRSITAAETRSDKEEELPVVQLVEDQEAKAGARLENQVGPDRLSLVFNLLDHLDHLVANPRLILPNGWCPPVLSRLMLTPTPPPAPALNLVMATSDTMLG
jgi:hypothetical protein